MFVFTYLCLYVHKSGRVAKLIGRVSTESHTLLAKWPITFSIL